MSYKKMMNWNRKHRKGTKQPVIMHTESGFWPSAAFSKKWRAYAEEQERQGLPYMSMEQYYRSQP